MKKIEKKRKGRGKKGKGKEKKKKKKNQSGELNQPLTFNLGDLCFNHWAIFVGFFWMENLNCFFPPEVPFVEKKGAYYICRVWLHVSKIFKIQIGPKLWEELVNRQAHKNEQKCSLV